jgi:hypothetical protein
MSPGGNFVCDFDELLVAEYVDYGERGKIWGAFC